MAAVGFGNLPPRAVFRPFMSLWEGLHKLLVSCLPPEMQILRRFCAFWVSDCLFVAVRLNIPDILADGAKDVHGIVEKIEGPVNVDHLSRLLRFLAASGDLSCDESGRFGLTRASALLCSGPTSLAPAVLMYNDRRDHRIGWSHLEEAVRTGGCGFEIGSHIPIWQYYGENPEFGNRSQGGFRAFTQLQIEGLVHDYNWSAVGSIVDVGGGAGGFMDTLIKQYPSLKNKVVVFDRPEVVERIDPLEAEKAGMKFQAGDFFAKVEPSGRDVYVMKHILHDWTDAECTAILRRVKEAMENGGNPNSKLLIIDVVLEGPSDPLNLFKVGMDLNMMAMVSGRERTLQEWDELFHGAGFVRVQVHTIRTYVSILEAKVRAV